MVELLMKFKKVSDQLFIKLKRKPRMTEVARKMRMSVKKIRQLSKMASKISSLNAPIGDDGTAEFIDLIEDESIVTADDEVGAYLQRERILELLKNMSPRERKILSLRFGLKNGIPHTLRDTAKHFGITRERVRQIESAAMRKLRNIIVQQESTVT